MNPEHVTIRAMPLDFQSIVARHGFSAAAITVAWEALCSGGGSMAQFNHRELGGGGQWMPGMVMIGDMFNHDLKARVDRLFLDLRNQLGPADLPSHASVTGGPSLHYGSPESIRRTWYPPDLGSPSIHGSQNDVRYAYFPDTRRLAIELHGKLTIYDTAYHTITAVSQAQQGDAGTITFTSQSGVIPIAALRVVGS
jgi:hypothetical protein